VSVTPYHYILVFINKETFKPVMERIDDAVDEAREELNKEIRAGGTFDASTFLSRYKSLIAEKVKDLPGHPVTRIAVVENSIIRPISREDVQRVAYIAGWDESTETFIFRAIPSFTKISDPAPASTNTPLYEEVEEAIKELEAF